MRVTHLAARFDLLNNGSLSLAGDIVDNDGLNAMLKHNCKDAEYRRIEVITGQKRRRDWTAEEKAEIVAATIAPGATVTEVARRFDVSRALLWTWRRKAMAELAAEMGPRFVPL